MLFHLCFSMGFNWGVRRLHLCTWPLRRRCFVFFFSLFLMRYALLQKWDESKLFMAWKLLLIKITKHHIDFLTKLFDSVQDDMLVLVELLKMRMILLCSTCISVHIWIFILCTCREILLKVYGGSGDLESLNFSVSGASKIPSYSIDSKCITDL